MDRQTSIPGGDPLRSDPEQVNANTDRMTVTQTGTLTIVNASDDLKIDSLRKNTPYLLTLSEDQGIPSNQDTIEEPAPDYRTTPEPTTAAATTTTTTTTTNSILKTIPDRKVEPKVAISTSGSPEGRFRTGGDRQQARAFSKGMPRGRRRRHDRPTSGSTRGVDNAIFQPDDDVTGRRRPRTEAEKANGLRKKVSWNETVVYNSDEKTDVIIAGLHEEESDTDDPDVGDYRYSPRSRVFLDMIPEDRPMPSRGGSSVEEKWPRRPRQGRVKDKASDYKCPLCSAVVLIALAVVGIVVLGTMYGVRYGSEKKTSEIIEEIRQTFSLKNSEANSLFIYSSYRPPSYQEQDSATYFLLEKDSIMPWQSPDGAATITWLKGGPVKVQVIDRRGRVFLRLLSDPVTVQGAQYTVSMSSTDWYAAKLLHPNSYALVAMAQEGTSANWVRANISELYKVVTLPYLREEIVEYVIPEL